MTSNTINTLGPIFKETYPKKIVMPKLNQIKFKRLKELIKKAD